MKKNILIVLDMLNDFLNGTLANPRMERIISPIEELIKKAQKSEDWMTIFLCDSHAKDDREFELFGKHAIRGSEGAKIIPQLEKYAHGKNSYTILKSSYSGLFTEDFGSVLVGNKPEKIVVAGVCTDICVYFAVHDLWRLGYKVIIPLNAVETYEIPGHDAELMNRIFIGHMRHIFGTKIVQYATEIEF